MTEICPKCKKEGTPYTSKSKPSKSGSVTYHKYFKHSERTHRSGEVLQFTHYAGPIDEKEFLLRRKKPIIESTEANDQRFEDVKEGWITYRKELQDKIDDSKKKSEEQGKDIRASIKPGGVINRLDIIFQL